MFSKKLCPENSVNLSYIAMLICAFAIFLVERSYIIEKGISYISIDTEKEIGKTIFERHKKELNLVFDKEVILELNNLTKNLFEKNENQNLEYKIFLNQEEEVNAYAMAGGYLIVNTGLIAEMNSASELLGVIAHEMAHINLRHTMKQSVGQLFSYMVYYISDSLMAYLWDSNSYSQQHEKEADLYAIKYLVNADISPFEFQDFFKANQDINLAFLNDLLSTHPASDERISYIEANSAIYKDRVFPEIAFNLASFKQKIKALESN